MGITLSCGLRPFQPGLRTLEIPFPIYLFYPTYTKPSTQHFGPYSFDAALNTEEAVPAAPLILISHRSGCSPWELRDLAPHLACHGYRVVLADYPAAKEFGEKRILYIPSVLARTGEIQTILNFLQLDSVVLLGHSFGASTLLGLAGGIAAHANANGIADPRLRALVLLAPATSWYQNPGVLVKVQVPILMITAEHDQYFPPATAQIIQQGLPPTTPFEHHMVPNAGHYSFQSVDPESINTPDSLEAQDPPGFDRTAYQQVLASLIAGFLHRHIFFPLATSAKS